ncbi:MAG: hypothetical protein QOJ16_3986 [Acidobacteriota bacterium]|jgi:hypothetical protein|nr:hypothetical protein [Acidobacteriota bacterium]
MTHSKPTLARHLFLPTTLLALTLVAACVNRAELPRVTANPAPTTSTADIAPLPTLPATVSIVPLSVPAPPAASSAAPVFAGSPAGLSPKVLRAALDAVACARSRGVSGRKDLLTVIDYSLPSSEPRLWVLDLAHGKVLFHDLVAHGAGSGDNYARQFSNTMDSRQTSLGLFLTEGTYEGGNGYSLRLRGLDPGVNDQAEARNIVMHGAWYVSAEHVREHGRLGRSWGCPALSVEEARPVIETVKGGSFVYAYAGSAASGNVFASSGQRCGAGSSPNPAAPASGAVVEAKAAALASIPEPVKTAQP